MPIRKLIITATKTQIKNRTTSAVDERLVHVPGFHRQTIWPPATLTAQTLKLGKRRNTVDWRVCSSPRQLWSRLLVLWMKKRSTASETFDPGSCRRRLGRGRVSFWCSGLASQGSSSMSGTGRSLSSAIDRSIPFYCLQLLEISQE